MTAPPKVLVIGGGISGLSTAWWLAQSGVSVEVWERNHRLGGKIETTRKQGYQLEQAAALLLNFRPEVAELVHKSGLEPHKTSRSPLAEQNRYLLSNGALNSMTMGVGNFFLSRQWSLKGKLRMMMEPLVPRGGSENETVAQFIVRRFGQELLDKAIDPYVSGTLASDPELANAQTTLGRLTALEKKFGSLTLGALIHRLNRTRSACVTETFSFDGGMSTLIRQLAEHPNISVRTHHEAVEIEPALGKRWRAGATHLADNSHREALFDQVIFSSPTDTTATLLDKIAPEIAKLLDGIEYASLAVLHTGFDRQHIAHPLDGTGFLTPRSEATPFNGNIWMSSLFRGRAPEGKALLTTYLGGARHPEVDRWSDSEIVERTMTALQPILGIGGAPELTHLHRHQRALPLYHGPYAARMKQLKSELEQHRGLHIAANYLGGISVRDRIAEGQKLAERITAEMSTSTHLPSSPHWPTTFGSPLAEGR